MPKGQAGGKERSGGYRNMSAESSLRRKDLLCFTFAFYSPLALAMLPM